ncbi:General substrate transporter [Ascosphaera apis ARSEF 7405]|uniref:General substrate transporter n=1 Tax=Ascosphaera apis ARSEF 7405 TaxID=392613 RepID=A0A162IML3_9EURO|nr:General substrate transporter [Ascosphaera apis ARSEF 7405]
MGKGYVICLAIFAATGSFLFGYDSGVMTNVIASPHFLNYFDTDPDSDIVGALNSTFSGGAAVGALVAGTLADMFGRKYTIQIGATIATIGAILQAAAVKLSMLLVGRIISGLAIGSLSMVIPVYQTECAHPDNRGLIVGIAQQMIGAGWIISSWLGYACGYASGPFQWRFPLAFQGLPSFILMFGMFIFPESPRYLIQKLRYDEGIQVLRKLHYTGSNDDWIQQEFQEAKEAYEIEGEVDINPWKAMFVIPQWRRRTMIACAMHAFGQSTGINAIGYYQTIMYRNLGVHGHTITLLAACYNLVGPSTCLFFIIFLADRVGRRKPLLWGACAVTLCLVGEAVFQAVNQDGTKKGLSAMGILCIWLVTGFFSLSYGPPLLWGACAVTLCLVGEAVFQAVNQDGTKKGLSAMGILCIWLVTGFFSLSYGPVCWVYISEILPMQIRGTGVALATGIGHWGVNVMWSQVTPKGLNKIHWKFYLVFVAVNVFITIPSMYFFFPETKGVPLEEMDSVFGGAPDLSKWRNPNAPPREKTISEHVEAKDNVTADVAEV